MKHIDLQDMAKRIAADTFLIYDDAIKGHEAFDLFLANPSYCPGVKVDAPYLHIPNKDIATELEELHDDILRSFLSLFKEKVSIH